LAVPPGEKARKKGFQGVRNIGSEGLWNRRDELFREKGTPGEKFRKVAGIATPPEMVGGGRHQAEKTLNMQQGT